MDLVMGTLTNKIVAPITQDGKAEISGLPAGVYQLMFKRDKQTLGVVDVPLKAGEAGHVKFTVPDERTVRGTVTLDGKPVTGGVVRCGPVRSEVNADGSFALTLSRLGRRAIAYHPSASDDKESWGGTYNVTEDDALSLDFWMASLRATILAPDGQPQSNVSGLLSGPSRREFVSDADGRIAIDSMIAREYRWRIRSTDVGYGPATTLRVEGDTVADYRLLASREVHIVVRQPEAQRGWTIQLQGLGADGERWSIPQLGPDRYNVPLVVRHLYASTSSSAPVMLELSPDRSDGYEIQLLEPGGKLAILAGDVQRVRIEPLGNVALHPRQQWVRLNGATARERLPVGRYRLTPDDNAQRAVEIEVAEGSQAVAQFP